MIRSILLGRQNSIKTVQNCGFVTTSSTNPFEFGESDVGKLYSVPSAEYKDGLHFDSKFLPKKFRRQIGTFNELVWMFRRQTHETFKCIQTFKPGEPAQRLVLWGKFGTGKSMTLYQLAHMAYTQKYVLLTIPDAMSWARDDYYEVQISTYKQNRLNSPVWAQKILTDFKSQNRHIWHQIEQLKATKKYAWSQVEITDEGKPITEIVEIGLSAPFLATDCLGALGRELRIHSTEGRIRLLVAMDKANGLYGKCKVKRTDHTIATVNELALTIHMRKFLMPIWSNGICAMIADKAEISDSRNTLSVPVNDPRSIFGEKGFEQIEPFISVETELYSQEEIEVMFDYYLEKNWINQSPGPGGEEARRQLIYLSAFNPYYFERACAFPWKLDTTIAEQPPKPEKKEKMKMNPMPRPKEPLKFRQF